MGRRRENRYYNGRSTQKLMNDFSFMSYAPIIFISAKTGQRLDRLFELIKFVDTQNAMRISTGKLNDVLSAATTRVQPPTDKGRRLKIYYMTQLPQDRLHLYALSTAKTCSITVIKDILTTKYVRYSGLRERPQDMS